MENDKTKHGIQYKVTACMGLAGLLLGLLVNTISAIKFDEFNENQNIVIYLKFFILATTSCLTMSIFYGFAAHPGSNSDRTNIDITECLKHSMFWLLLGLAFISVIIAIIVTNSIKYTLIFLLITFLLISLDISRIEKKKK